jgi:multiple sugar transport system ATP-binding protein
VQQFADPDTVYNRPANLFVARFMGAPPMNTMPARLAAAGDGLCAVIGAGRPDEIRLTLPSGIGPLGELIDRPVVLGIRPEAIAEADRRFGAAGSTALTLEVPVELVEPTGAETIVLLRLGGERALGRIAPDIRVAPGKSARFTLDTSKIRLFDPTTERLIA